MQDNGREPSEAEIAANRKAIGQLRAWRASPLQMVRELFGVEPDPWQADVLEAFPHKPRIALLACKGPGKTCLLAWLAWNFLLTRPFPKMAATSISGDNLRDNLWAEMAKWREKSALLKNKFEWTSQRIFCREFPETWFMSARTWPRDANPERQADTLAGLHADYIMFLLDESGSIPESVMVAAEAALSSCIEGHIIQAGNPTMLSGPLYRAGVLNRNLWHVVEITGDPDNPKRSPRISVEWAREQIATHGEDNPWVLVNVFGRFPPSSINSLIGPDEVRDAMKRFYRPYEIGGAAKVLGVDVAREPLGDASVIFSRQGIQCFPMVKRRGVNSTQGAGLVSRTIDDWGADATFVDATGGFGAGWIDQLLLLKKSPIGVQFAGKAHDIKRYFNKRTEMYFDAVQWIKRGGALPPDANELLGALTNTTYTFKGDRLILEPKEAVKLKLGYSPDEADGFVLTFAEPVSAKTMTQRPRQQTPDDYNPFASLDKMVNDSYDPYRS